MTELPQRDSARLVIKIQRALHPPLAARQSDRDNIILNPTQRGVTSDRKLAAKQLEAGHGRLQCASSAASIRSMRHATL
jgi:hypothetical protein